MAGAAAGDRYGVSFSTARARVGQEGAGNGRIEEGEEVERGEGLSMFRHGGAAGAPGARKYACAGDCAAVLGIKGVQGLRIG